MTSNKLPLSIPVELTHMAGKEVGLRWHWRTDCKTGDAIGSLQRPRSCADRHCTQNGNSFHFIRMVQAAASC
jgi:hypothetical protein